MIADGHFDPENIKLFECYNRKAIEDLKIQSI
jgi:hypothetical protein